MIEYSINEMGIVWVTFKGEISVDELHEFIHEFTKVETLPEHLLALYDMRSAHIKLNPDSMEDLAILVNKVTKRFKSIKAAFIVNEPDQTALSFLFKQTKKNRNTVREVFSTTEAGVNWLFMF